MVAPAVRVEGLRELQKALKATSEQPPKAIQKGHKRVAEIVTRVAKQKASGTTLPERITASGTTRKAQIRFKGHRNKRGSASKKTDAFLQEFGGSAPLFGNLAKRHIVKPRRKGGYIVYPAIAETRDRVEAEYIDIMDDELRLHWQQ